MRNGNQKICKLLINVIKRLCMDDKIYGRPVNSYCIRSQNHLHSLLTLKEKENPVCGLTGNGWYNLLRQIMQIPVASIIGKV